MQHVVEIDYETISKGDAKRLLFYLQFVKIFAASELMPGIPPAIEELHKAISLQLDQRHEDTANDLHKLGQKLLDVMTRRLGRHPGHDERIQLAEGADWCRAMDVLTKSAIPHSFGLRPLSDFGHAIVPYLYFPLDVDKGKVYRILRAEGIGTEYKPEPEGHVIHVPLAPYRHEIAVSRHLLKAGVAYRRLPLHDTDCSIAYSVNPADKAAANLAMIGAYAEALREGNIVMP